MALSGWVGSYLLQGEFQLEQDRLDDAAATFELAAPLIKGADAQHRAGLCAEQAKLAARQGHGEHAVALAEKALAILGSGTPAEQGRARWALAEGLAAQGKIEKAMREFGRAEQLLTGEGRYTRQLLQARATIARKAGNFDEAIDLLKRATQAPAVAARQTRA